MGRTNFHKKDLFLKEGGCRLLKLATSSWPVTRLAWNVSSKPKNATATNQVVLCGSMDELRATQLNPLKSEAFYKNIGMKISCLIVSFLGVASYAKLRLSEMDVKNSWAGTVRGTSCFVIKFSKLVDKIARNVGKRGRWFTLLQPTLPVKVTAKKSKESVSVSKGAVDLVIEADDYVASIQPDKTIETRYEQVWWSLWLMPKKRFQNKDG